MATLADIRAKLKAQETRSTTGPADNAVYPFWNIKEGDTAVIRFLPDADDTNTFFWRERAMIRLPFQGVKGGDHKEVTVQIPCMEMYGESCPILNEVRGWFKDSSLEDMGRKYWKKRSYIFQGFVVDNPLAEDTKPENPIRRFVIGPQVFQLIKEALMDPDMEELPTDYTAGLDFRLKKTSKGGYADYSTSSWARRTRPLDDKEMHAVNTNGLFNLNDFLPKKPTDVELKAMLEMFEASVDGQPYDEDLWGAYYRPYGIGGRTETESAPKPAPKPAPVAETEDEVRPEDVLPDEEPPPKPSKAAKKSEEPAGDAGSSSANDILAMIRARQNKD